MLEVGALVDAACAQAGSDEFGGDSWQEGLDVLVHSLGTEGALNELGEGVYADMITGFLVNRLEVETCYALHPEIDDEVVRAPLFGLGMPRTGSTALSFLLACDPARRALRTWEAGSPCPPPEKDTEDTDPRIATSQAGIDAVNVMFPDFAGMLPSSATGPQECLLIMAMDFRSQVFEGMALLPGYDSWLLTCDMEPAYRYHRRVLKLLQWHCPPDRWWLKTPAHMHSIVALDAVYPDARFVMTHRDIAGVLPSLCALKEALGGPLLEHLDLVGLGRFETGLWSEALRRLVEFRDAGHDHRFFDVSFTEVQRDPLAAVEQLYAALGDELSDDTRRSMTQWWTASAEQRPQGRRPDPARFGMDATELHDQFEFYHRRFGVALDG